MDDMESQKFEHAFKGAFANAEVEPSENVWNNIELDLARKERGELKRGILFYKLLAAACVTFAMCAAGMGYYAVQNNNALNAARLAERERKIELLLAEAKQSKESIDGSLSAKENSSGSFLVESNRVSGIDNSSLSKKSALLNRNTANASTFSSDQQQFSDHGMLSANDGVNYNIATAGNTAITNREVGDYTTDPRETSNQYAARIQRLPKSTGAIRKQAEPEPDPVAIMMARLAREEMEMRGEDASEKKKNKPENLWTSVGFAAGAFNTISSGGSVTQSASFANVRAASNNNVADHQAKASGVTYSAGVSVGTRLTERWILQGGLNYMAQSSDYTADAVATSDYQNFKAGSLSDMQSVGTEFLATSPYSVNNNARFLSVPLQAGYLVVDKKFGVQVNAGVSTDLFLQNTLTPESETLSKTTQSRGAESPYRPLNFSGLFGTELSYRLGPNYRLALNPGIRYPFNSIYKSELGIKAMPLTFDVGLKFRYIFN